MSFLQRFKEKRETKREEKVRYRGEKLAVAGRERYAASLGAKERAMKKEAKALSHPYREQAAKGVERTGGRIIGFAGELVKKEIVPSFRKTSRAMRGTAPKVRQNRPRGPSGRSFAAPTGFDNSLSGGIARNDWAGDRNLMDREFFGSSLQVPQSQRDLLGPRVEREMVSGDTERKKKIRYY